MRGETWKAALSSWRTISAGADPSEKALEKPLAPSGEQMALSCPMLSRLPEDFRISPFSAGEVRR
jgi:hypothetical protein